MTPHHLELFYYVARYGGISAAARQMPYGIQQPAISEQIGQFERELGTLLFRRQPFELTPAGHEIYPWAATFFEKVAGLKRQAHDRRVPTLRLAASEFALSWYFPIVMETLAKRHPGVRVTLRSGRRDDLERWVRAGEVDCAVAAVEAPPRDLPWRPVFTVPPVLLLPATLRRRYAAATTRPPLPTSARLICPPASEGVTRQFDTGLRQLGIVWPVQIEASSTAIVPLLVAAGHGVGVSLALGPLIAHPNVIAQTLPDFAPVTVGAFWREPAPALVPSLLEIAEAELEPSEKGALPSANRKS